MQRQTYELMLDHVGAIFQAVTGSKLPELERREPSPAPLDDDSLLRRFAVLEACARVVPQIAERIPPFAFMPPMDVTEMEKELLIELAVPGTTRDEVHVELNQDVLTVSGTRGGLKSGNGRAYRHAEIPRGPFRRVIVVPHEATAERPRVEVENGIIRIRFSRLPLTPVAQA